MSAVRKNVPRRLQSLTAISAVYSLSAIDWRLGFDSDFVRPRRFGLDERA